MAKQRTDTESVLKLVINGEQAKSSVTDLRNTFYKLTAEINNMRKADDPKAYAEKSAQVQKLKDAWNEARSEINGTTKSVKGFNAEFAEIAKGVFGGQMLTRAWDMASRGITDFISRNAELADMMASVIKTTGLNEAAVDRLNEKFKKFDTRTAKEELMGLAYVAGKLGYTMEADVEAFVRAADRIGVALGEELGGTEEAVRSIGKLVDIFKVNDTFGLEESLTKVGSIINELGQSGTAKEKYLIDFTQRMAGIAPVAGISMQAIMGMAATLDELGQPLEASSTAIGQFIVKMGADIPKFAKIAGMSVKDFTKLLKEDANEAFLRVLEASDSAGGGIQKLAENMGLIDVAGARGIAALGVLSGNVDKLREKQVLSNVAFDEGTSILEEFGNVNYNLAANLEKIKNRIAALWENSEMRSWFTDLTAWIANSRTEFEALTDRADKQTVAFGNLEKEIYPLVLEYDHLNIKVNKNKVEHDKLATSLQTLSKLYPGAITQVDEYGNAIDISTFKIKQLIKAEKDLLEQQNKKAIGVGKEELANEKRNLERLKAIATSGKEVISQGYAGGYSVHEKNLNNEELKAIQEQIDDGEKRLRVKELSLQKLGAEISFTATREEMKMYRMAEGQFDALKEKYTEVLKLQQSGATLSADQLKVMERYQKETGTWVEKPDENDSAVGDDGKKKKKTAAEVRAEKIKKEQENLKEFLDKNAQEIYQNSLAGSQKELAALHYKYDEKRKLANGDQELIKALNKQEGDDFMLLLKKVQTESEKTANELASKKAEIEQKIIDAGMDAYDLEIDQEKQKYAELIALAEEYGFDISELVEKREEKLLAIEKKYKDQAWEKEKKETDKKKEKEKEIRDFAIDSSKQVADAIFQIGENNRKARYDREFSELENQREKELSNKNLTESQKEAINKKYDEKNRELKRKEFKENQRAAISEAFINMALGIGKAIPNPWKMAFAGASGLAQIAVIKSQSPKFKKGGLLPTGSSHAEGGIDLWDQRRQQIIGQIEGGEPILSKETYANNREVVDELLYSSQRRAGARIQLDPELIDAERMVRNGGYAMNHKQAPPVVNVSNPAPDFTPMVSKMDEMIDAQKQANDKQVVFSTRALEDHNVKMAKLKNEVNA